MKIERYTTVIQKEWDDFVRTSRNGTFLFLRDYMDYHKDRFKDHSLLYYNDKGKLLAVMPANENGDKLWNHQGLTYGGFVLSAKAHGIDVGEMFQATIDYLRECGIKEWHYKSVPTIYQRYPSQEEDYWLWRYDATMEMCNLSCVVDLEEKDEELRELLNTRKQTYKNKLIQQGYRVDFNTPLKDFWPVLEENLKAVYDAKPVHSLVEIETLQASFAENIRCVTARNGSGEIEAGVVLFIAGNVVKTQYISASAEGKRTKALDFLMLSLIDHYREYSDYRYFDLGTSNADAGRYLHETLLQQKEGFGGRGVAYKGYRIVI